MDGLTLPRAALVLAAAAVGITTLGAPLLVAPGPRSPGRPRRAIHPKAAGPGTGQLARQGVARDGLGPHPGRVYHNSSLTSFTLPERQRR